MFGASAQAIEPSDENGDAGEQHGPAPVDVGELAVERRDRGRGKQIGGDDPGEVLDVRVGAPDGRERGRDDRLVKRREKHREHQAENDAPDSRMVEADGYRGGGQKELLTSH